VQSSTRKEIWDAVGKMKNGKAGDESGILAEMMCGDSEIMEMLTHQVQK